MLQMQICFRLELGGFSWRYKNSPVLYSLIELSTLSVLLRYNICASNHFGDLFLHGFLDSFIDYYLACFPLFLLF